MTNIIKRLVFYLSNPLNIAIISLYLIVSILPFNIHKSLFFDLSYIRGSFIFYNTFYVNISDVGLFISNLCLFLYALSRTFHDKQIPKKTLYIGLLLVSILITPSIYVQHETTTLSVLKLLLLLNSLIFVCFMININVVKQMFHNIFLLILANSLIQSIIGLYQYFCQKSIGISWLGEEFIRPYLPGLAKFKQLSGEHWIFDKLFDVYHETNVVRAYGTFPHPNIYGSFIAIGLLITVYLFIVYHETWKRRLLSGIIFIQTLGLTVSFSRVAICMYVLCVYAFLGILFYMKRGEVEVRQAVKKIFSITLVCLVVSAVLFYPQFVERGGVVSTGGTNKESIDDRVLYQRISLRMIIQHPWRGIGMQNFTRVMDEYSFTPLLPFQHQPVHNVFLLIAAESGLPAALAYCFLLGLIFYYGWKNRQSVLTLCLSTIVAGFVFISLFDHYPYTLNQPRALFFFALGLLVASFNLTGSLGLGPESEVSTETKTTSL